MLKYQHLLELEQKKSDKGTQSRQEQLEKNYGEHSVVPQAHERSEGGLIDLCGPAPHQGRIYPSWT